MKEVGTETNRDKGVSTDSEEMEVKGLAGVQGHTCDLPTISGMCTQKHLRRMLPKELRITQLPTARSR